MNTHYEKTYSRYLHREMECKVFGRAGQALTAFPCCGGRFYDWENSGMIEQAAPWIDSGRLQIFCVDGIDGESWAGQGEAAPRMAMQERWFNYICDEFYPRMLELNGSAQNGSQAPAAPSDSAKVSPAPLPLLAGCDLGAGHAVNFYCRRPQLFGGVIALSGCYRAADYFGEYTDDLVFRNSPCDFVAALPKAHPQLTALQKAAPFYLCAGQGCGEDAALASTRALQSVLQAQSIPAAVDFWGADVTHDFDWWRKEWRYFLEKALGKV